MMSHIYMWKYFHNNIFSHAYAKYIHMTFCMFSVTCLYMFSGMTIRQSYRKCIFHKCIKLEGFCFSFFISAQGLSVQLFFIYLECWTWPGYHDNRRIVRGTWQRGSMAKTWITRKRKLSHEWLAALKPRLYYIFVSIL